MFDSLTKETINQIKETRDGVIELKVQIQGVIGNNELQHKQCAKDHECTRKKIVNVREENKKDVNGLGRKCEHTTTGLRKDFGENIAEVHRKIERHTFGSLKFIGTIVGIILTFAVSVTGLYLAIGK